tara:strand:- start:64 stop:435 length:372 start_codon:yes stop_codon:yes gene_type:complete
MDEKLNELKERRERYVGMMEEAIKKECLDIWNKRTHLSIGDNFEACMDFWGCLKNENPTRQKLLDVWVELEDQDRWRDEEEIVVVVKFIKYSSYPKRLLQKKSHTEYITMLMLSKLKITIIPN